MADLMQYVEMATQANNDPIDWGSDYRRQYIVPASNRTRILDREATRGHHPGEDGWLTVRRDCGHWTDHFGQRVDVTHWTRIRWEPLPHTETQDLDQKEAQSGVVPG